MASPVRCVSPVDTRPVLGQVGSLGLLICLCATELGRPTPPFWSLTRRVSDDVQRHRNPSVVVDSLRPVRDRVLTGTGSSTTARAAVDNAPAVMVSNYGRLADSVAGLRVTALSPFVATGNPDTQTVSAASVGETLALGLVAQQPLTGFLDRVVDLLSAASQ